MIQEERELLLKDLCGSDSKPAAWSEDDKRMLGKVLECIGFAEDHYQLVEEAANGVSVKMWLLDHINPQPKQEWTEEDEAKRNSLICLVEEIKNQPLKRLEDWDGYISWLKSIKERMKNMAQ